MVEQVSIEQALFGYRAGHHLVAASVELAPRVRQLLANVTDGSGPENPDGFEGAYTGLPVPETNYYALFCTWSAPEMRRPGCVWSHVLLIDLADLARIRDLSVLRGLCLRPASPPFLADYERTLTVLSPDVIAGITDPKGLRRAACLLSLLYEEPTKGIVVLDEKSSLWEDPVFGLWSQQWPRLRRSFSFSTGSLGDRRVSDLSFDLQIAPLSSRRLWGREGFPTAIVEFSDQTECVTQPTWVEIAVNDLRAGARGQLREFFFAYGSDVETPRSAFVRLLECFKSPPTAEEDGHASRLLQIASSFPDPSEALRLKRDRLLGRIAGTESERLDFIWASVYFLLLTAEAVAFSQVPFDFTTYTDALWRRKRADIIALLRSLPESERATEFLRALAVALRPQELPAIWNEQTSTLPRLIAHRPDLAADATAWAMPQAGQRSLWESLRAATRDQSIWALVCVSMLRAQCAFAEHETVTLAGGHLAQGLLTWLVADHFRLPSSAWRQALRTPLVNELGLGDLAVPLLALAVWTLPPAEARALSGHRRDVQTLCRDFAVLPEPLRMHTLFWMTALGFQTPGQDGLALFARAFFPVYDAVARSEYPGDAWDLLGPILPELMWGLDWDRCLRLRRALRSWLRDNSSFAERMAESAPTAEHRRLIQGLSSYRRR